MATSILNERFVAGRNGSEVVRARLIGPPSPELICGMLGAAIIMLAQWRLYGVFPDFVRSLFGLPPGGRKPVSIDPGS